MVHTPLLHARVRHAWRRPRLAVAALVCWVINLGLSATADIIARPALGVASLILTPVLVILLVLTATTRPLRTPTGPGRTAAMTTLEMLLRLDTGLGLGALIGVQRQWRAPTPGCAPKPWSPPAPPLFVLLSAYSFATTGVPGVIRTDPTQAATQIVSGIGFLGTGVILRGLNTTATL